MRRKARMRIIIFLLTITLGILALSQASSESASNASVRKFPATPPSGTYFDHLVFIIMENAGMSNICGSGNNPPPCNGPDNPYMSGLANSYGLATRYVDLQGTSQPNYIGIMAATLNGCTSSCGPGTLTETNLVDRFDTAGLGWKAYMEDQTPVAGCDNNDHGFYEIAHNPFVAFHDIDTNSTRCNRIVLANPANNSTCTGTDCALVKDLNSGSAPNFLWVTPNDCNNAHGNSACPNGCISSYTSPCEKAGDNYLSGLVPNILNSNTFKNTRAALFITFDEGSGFCPLNGSGEDCMYTVWAGPTAKTSFSSSTLRDHYAFTKTIETNWNLATMTSNDAGATAMAEFFNSQSPDFTITASPSSLTFPTGNSANSTITLSSLGSFAGTVTLTKSSTPTGLTLTLNPTSVTLPAGGTATSTLTVSSSTIGNYTATVTGTGSGHTHNTTLTVQVTPPPNFALSVNPTSLTLTHAVSGVASPVTVHSTADRTVFESSYLANSFYAKGLYWIFYEDSSNTCEHQAGCLTYATSTNGTSWAAPTTVPVHITDSDFSVTTNGTSVFYVRYNETTYISNCGRRIQFGLGNLASSGAVTWQPEKTVAVGASNRAYPDDEIILDSNGQVWIGFLIDNHGPCGGNSTDLPQVIHSAGTNYNSWTGNTTLTTAHSGNWHVALVSLGSGLVYASFWIGNTDVHGRLFNNGWQADEQVSSTTTLSDVNGWLFNSATNVYMIYFDDSTESFNFATRSSSGTWTSNRIGIGESHTGSQAFPGYYSLPDAAGYDVANNQFHLFYMNATNQRVDEWTGSGSSWNKTTGVVRTTAVPYADSITSFIQSNPIEVGGIFYISGSSSPFTLNFASLTFTSTNLTGTFTVTITSQNGFTGTVNLTTATVPSTGLTVACSTTTITGGSGSSLCSASSTTPGNYNVTVTGVSGLLSHSANVVVTVPAGPDFTITATSLSPINLGQSPSSTISVTALNGFTGVVSLTDTPPSGLTCSSISPNSVTNSGTATVSCSATIAGNYTLTLTGISGSLSHSTTALFQFRDFNISASSPVPVNTGSSAISTITVTAVNHFSGAVTLTDTIPSGLVCGTINPSSLAGSGTATVSCNSSIAGNYTLTITSTSGSLVHNATSLFQFRDFTIAASSININAGTSATSTVTISAVNRFTGTVTLTDTVPSGLVCNPITPGTITGSGTAAISCSATVPANYTLTITGTSGSLTHNAAPIFHVQDFGLTGTSPAPLNVGSSATSTITTSALNHFAGAIALTDTLPIGLTCGTITPNTVTGSGTATVACTATSAGNYTLMVTGKNGALSHSATIVISVQDYTITISPSSVSINAGDTGSSSITITALNHFTGNVSLSATSTSGLTVSVSPTSLSGGSGTATLIFNSGTAGNYTAVVTSSNGTLTHTTSISVQVEDFGEAANPISITILAGATGSSTVTTTALNGFRGIVSLALTPAIGLTGAVVPASIDSSGSSIMSVRSLTSGNYTITVKATSGSLSHTITVIVHVLDYGLSGNPVNVVAPIGSSTSSTLTIQSLNHYSGNITLTYSVQAAADPSSSSASGGGGGHRPFIAAPLAILPNVSINPLSFQLFPGGTQQSAVSISLPSNLLAGNYLITVLASNGTLSHQIYITITATDFSISATPTSAIIRPGSNTTIVVNLQSLNFFQGTVNLTVASQAGGPTGTLSTSLVQLTSYSSMSLSLTIQVSANTVLGNYTITVQATSGTVSHTLIIPVRISSSGFVTILAGIFSSHSAISISSMGIFTLLTLLVTLRIRNTRDHGSIAYRRRRIENRISCRPATNRSPPISSTIPPFRRPESRDRI